MWRSEAEKRGFECKDFWVLSVRFGSGLRILGIFVKIDGFERGRGGRGGCGGGAEVSERLWGA